MIFYAVRIVVPKVSLYSDFVRKHTKRQNYVMILYIYEPVVKIERSALPKNDLIIVCLVFWSCCSWIRRSCLNRVVITSHHPPVAPYIDEAFARPLLPYQV